MQTKRYLCPKMSHETVGGGGTQTDGDDRLCTDHGKIKTLLLFEDVDATLCEDRGFISTIQQLADTGKKPMILTSNNENPELPSNLDREEISFVTPSLKEMIHHISLVCAAEKACIQPHLIERCIDFCEGDIRKSLMHLQFWCQQKGCIKVDSHFPVPSPVVKDMSKEFGDQLLNYGTIKLEETTHHFSEAADANHANSFPVSNSSDLNVNPPAANFPGTKCHSRQLLDLNNSYFEEPRDSYNQFNEEIRARCSAKNPFSDQPIHFGEVKVAETEFGVAANQWLNLSSDQLQQCGQTNTITEGLIPCKEATTTKFQDSGKTSQEAANDSSNQLFEQSPSCVIATMENIQHQQPVITSLNPFSYQNLDVSSNSFGDHLFHGEVGEQSLKVCKTVGGHLSQPNAQDFRPAISKETQERKQQQHSRNDYINCSLSLLPDVSLEQNQQTETKSSVHQSPKSNINFGGCLTDGNSMSPLSGKALNFVGPDVNHMVEQCWSVDVSCVPESTFVPETEVNDGTETPVGMDMIDIVSPVTYVDADTSILRLGVPETSQTDIDLNVSLRNEDLCDSQSDSEHHEASTSGRQVMDECSRMGFYKKPKRLKSFRSELKFPVQEKWNELRFADLREYCVCEPENSLQMLDLAFGVCNLISEGDLLLRDCEFLINDSCNQHADLSEETFTFGWHDQQIQMATVIAEHGYCLYSKDINALQLKMGTDNPLHLDWELLTSTNNSVTLGKLLRLNKNKSHSLGEDSSTLGLTIDSNHTRVRATSLTNLVRSIAPLKSYLALKGNAIHDYLSSLAHISTSEASRLAERDAAQKTKRRRVRATKNYLCSGALDLSSDDISLLNKYRSCN